MGSTTLLGTNILVLFAELSLVILVLYLINWIASKILLQLTGISQFKLETRTLKSLRQTIRSILILTGAVLCLLLVGVNGWLIYQGENLQEYTIALFRRLPAEFWLTLATGIAKSIGSIGLAAFAIRPLHRAIDWVTLRAQTLDDITANDLPIEQWFGFLKKHLTNGIWLLAVLACTQFLGLPAVVSQNLAIALEIYAIVAVGLLIVKANQPLIDSLDALSERYTNSDNLLRFYSHLRHLVPLLKRCLEYAIYASMATLTIDRVEPFAFLANYGPVTVKIIGIIFLCRVLIEVTKLTIEAFLLNDQNMTASQSNRRQTFVPLMESAIVYLIYFSTGIATLYTINVDPAPILASAGIIGFAIGLGSENLVNDLVCGFFILFENYYLVGDYINLGEVEGTVEAIELRTTRIRHRNGQVCIIRNGEINNVINYSKEYVYAEVAVGVAYDEQLDRVYQIIESIGLQLKENSPDVLEPTIVDGLEEFGDFQLLVRTITKVKPGKHLPMQGQIRKLIKEAFEREGIEIPFAKSVRIFKDNK